MWIVLESLRGYSAWGPGVWKLQRCSSHRPGSQRWTELVLSRRVSSLIPHPRTRSLSQHTRACRQDSLRIGRNKKPTHSEGQQSPEHLLCLVGTRMKADSPQTLQLCLVSSTRAAVTGSMNPKAFLRVHFLPGCPGWIPRGLSARHEMTCMAEARGSPHVQGQPGL